MSLALLTAEVPGTRQELEYELRRVRGEIEIRELYFSRLAAELARREREEEYDLNDQTPIDWLRHHCGLTQQAAADRIHVGEKLPVMEKSEDAFYNGRLAFQHLAVMARTAVAVGDRFDETKLLPLALKSSPGKFHFQSLHYRHSVLPEKVAEEQAELAERRYLKLSTCEDGCVLLNALLDPVGGAAVRTVLEAAARPSGKFDYRDRDKRLGDALVERLTGGGRVRVQMQVTSSIETLLGQLGAPGAETEFSLPISSKTVERWACDCSLTRVLMRDSVVIDVGRAQRVIAGPKRRALIARDRHCRWPGCERPASWCDGHHLKRWIDGGGLELENMVLLCERHHWLVHEGGWQLIKTDGGEFVPIAPQRMQWLPASSLSPPD